MEWHDSIAEGLPAPRDDEPESLRGDIADELGDHLHCALNRELHRTPDQTQAQHNVLEHFGDPARIARHLWFDAMKERLMSQRIMLSLVCVTAAAAVVACVLIWQMFEQSQTANRTLLTSIQDSNQNMVAALERMSQREARQATHSDEWSPIKVRLVLGEENGPPAVGFSVTLNSPFGFGTGGDASEMINLSRETGDNGIADFGLLRSGRQYRLFVITPWGESSSEMILAGPGRPETATFVCPAVPPEMVDVRTRMEWPNDLRDEKLWLLCLVNPSSRAIDGRYWGDGMATGQFLLVAPTSHEERLAGDAYSVVEAVECSAVEYSSSSEEQFLQIPGTNVGRHVVQLLSGSYSVTHVRVLLPRDEMSNDSRLSERDFRIVAELTDPRSAIPISEALHFTVDPNRENTWNITLNDAALTTVRESLKRTKQGDIPLEGLETSRDSRVFRALDRDRNGELSASEWTASGWLRRNYERAKIELTPPISEETFRELSKQYEQSRLSIAE